MTETSKQPKVWYKRKRFWSFVIFMLLIYFCLVPSRLRISPETTGITEPLTADGRVDYFAAFEKTYIDKLSPPEENGQRLLIAAFGPRILEQLALMNTVPWEEMPTHELSKNWFNNDWIPLCEHLYIDPYKKPMFYGKRGFFSYMEKYFKEQKKESGEVVNDKSISDDCKPLFDKLTAAPWNKEDYSEVGKWLDEYSEALDYVGMCMRKPNLACWRKNADYLMAILLPDVQASRDFVRSLQVRINERIGRGDIEGAWYDIMTLKYHARHYVNDSLIVTNLVGMVANSYAAISTKLLLIHCKPNEEQLAKFVSDLNNLPSFNPTALNWELEELFTFQTVQSFKYRDYSSNLIENNSFKEDILLYLISLLPYDSNIAGQRLTELYNESGLKDSKLIVASNPILRRQYADKFEKSMQLIEDKLHSKLLPQLFRLPLIRTRSKLLAELIFDDLIPAVMQASIAFDRHDAQNEMQRIAIALERYKFANGKYPDKLDDLVPKYLNITPIDPFTGRSTFVYKLRETTKETIPETKQPATESVTKIIAETTPAEITSTEELPKPLELPYILYSLGPNGKDDNGTLPPVSRPSPGVLDYDIVF
ncbi:MAG: hypothetical protein LBG58_11495 [Planctomycetaceae bacterium]|jgi:hypothetical protein|nr:hypothetical protein [Planctomycetaceae bacterium]